MVEKFRSQMQHARHALRTLSCVVALATSGALGACGDEATESASPEGGGTSAPLGETAWLGLADEMLPEEWLVRRTAKAVGAIDPKAVDAARTLLREASKRFGDEPRMIANRAAQLESMLAEKGQREDAMGLIETLMRIGSNPTGGFAAVCQFYFNLRMQGLDREQALNALAKRYGPGSG